MSNQSYKVNTTQPQKTDTSSSTCIQTKDSNLVYTPTNSVSTSNNTSINYFSSIGNIWKQGISTGVGFGMANSTVETIINNMSGNSQETMTSTIPITSSNLDVNPNIIKLPNSCESFLNLYTDCLKSQGNLMEDNCEYFLANFKHCQNKNKTSI